VIYFIYLSRLRSGSIIKETKANVWIQETGYRPERIWKERSDFVSFGTFEEAKAEMIARMEATIAKRERELEAKRESLAKLKALTLLTLFLNPYISSNPHAQLPGTGRGTHSQ